MSGEPILVRERLLRPFEHLLQGVECCYERKLIVPTMILVYSGIDTAARLDKPVDVGVQEAFTGWVDAYLLPRTPTIKCTAMELYAARCGVVHTLGADSKIARGKRGRRVVYAWGTSTADDLQGLGDAGRVTDFIAVQVEDLIEGFRTALEPFIADVAGDDERTAYAQQNARWFFGDITPAEHSAYAEAITKLSAGEDVRPEVAREIIRASLRVAATTEDLHRAAQLARVLGVELDDIA